jgi:hypothetical protein
LTTCDLEIKERELEGVEIKGIEVKRGRGQRLGVRDMFRYLKVYISSMHH